MGAAAAQIERAAPLEEEQAAVAPLVGSPPPSSNGGFVRGRWWAASLPSILSAGQQGRTRPHNGKVQQGRKGRAPGAPGQAPHCTSLDIPCKFRICGVLVLNIDEQNRRRW